MNGFWFKSDLFEVEPGEDEEINPGRYGRQLAIWLEGKLKEFGYDVEPVITEDWGRCLMCSRDPFMLWVGCGNMDTEAELEASAKGIVWHCFAVAEVSFWKRIFKGIDASKTLAKLEGDLRAIIENEPQIVQVEEP